MTSQSCMCMCGSVLSAALVAFGKIQVSKMEYAVCKRNILVTTVHYILCYFFFLWQVDLLPFEAKCHSLCLKLCCVKIAWVAFCTICSSN